MLRIPSMFDGVRRKAEVALELNVSVRKLDYYIKKLRNEGIKVETRCGPRAMKL